MKQKDGFRYTYSASQQKEVEYIRQKYVSAKQAEDKMELLRRLDRGVTNKATSVSLAVGVVGTLILGLGMSCAMVWDLFVPGILIGVAGIVPVALAHPVYKKVLEREKAKIAPKILQLTDELMQ